MLLIDLDHVVLGKLAATDRQEAGRQDLAGVADEHDPLAVAHAQRGAVAAMLGTVASARRAGPGQGIAAPLHHKPPVMRGLRRLHGIGLGLRPVVELFEDQFILLGLDPLFLDAAAHRHEEEQGPHGDAEGREELGHLVQQVDVPPANRGVDLHGHAQFAGGQEHLAGPLETAFPAAEVVVNLGVGAVEADAQPLDARLADPRKGLLRGQRRGGGREGHFQADAAAVGDQFHQVVPLQRIAAGEHDHRPLGELGDLRQKLLALLRAELLGVGILLRRGPAVLADQVAGRGGFVIEHQRTVIEVGCRVGRVIQRCPSRVQSTLGCTSLRFGARDVSTTLFAMVTCPP